MPRVVGVAFKPVTKVYYFDPADVADLEPGDPVIVETSRGRTLGRVVLPPREVPSSEVTGALKPVVRRATAWDLVQSDQMSHAEHDALQLCRARARVLGMSIKIVKVEYAFDGSSAVVYFSSEQRIDFRNLVHDLAQQLRTRVEMRQVGVRDEAKFIGGFGKCGRQLCCAQWLRDFAPVSIKMAKQQDLPLNSAEVSGVCGRLLCCLEYENDFYTEARKQMPRMNSVITTPEGPGKVKQIHVLRNSVTVKVEGPSEVPLYVEVPLGARADEATIEGGVQERDDEETQSLSEPSRVESPQEGRPDSKRRSSRRRKQPASEGGAQAVSEEPRDQSAARSPRSRTRRRPRQT
jgi:cell fate regulator YaaT (PSP1 superfamily)